MSINVFNSDCLEWLRQQPDNSIDSIVTDPPYGLSKTTAKHVEESLKAWIGGDTEYTPTIKGGFMGKSWDSFVPPPAVWIECLRVLKPGGHMAVFAGSRTQDLMGMSIRLAGFEIRDNLGWIYGSGFPKSMDVSKAIDKAAGAEREPGTPGRYAARRPRADVKAVSAYQDGVGSASSALVTAPATPEAKRWDGWGTSLKPAIEPIILARKPLDGTVAANVLSHGTGGLNIDACRVEAGGELSPQVRGAQVFSETANGRQTGWNREDYNGEYTPNDKGRFPANVLLDEHAAQEMDKQSGVSVSRRAVMAVKGSNGSDGLYGEFSTSDRKEMGHNDSGGASRFFPVFKYQAKAPKKERPVIEREDGTKIQHPTVKPVALMEWLVSLITPPNGVVLDPFAGTGTTLQAAHNKGFDVIGVEAEEEYVNLIFKRLTGNEE